MDILECLKVYTKLTIGDGLVSQIPAFIISLAAGLIVTRTSSRKDLGEEMLAQVFAKPKALIIASAFLGLMSITGLPKVADADPGHMLRRNRVDADEERKESRRPRRRRRTRQDHQERAGKSREASGPRHDGIGSRLRPGAAGRYRQRRRSPGAHQPHPPADRDGSGHHRSARAHPRQHAAWRQRLRHQDQGPNRCSRRDVSRAIPRHGQRRNLRPDPRRQPDHRAGLWIARLLDHRAAAGAGGADELHGRGSHRRPGDASYRSHQIARL